MRVKRSIRKQYLNILILGCDTVIGIQEVKNPTKSQKCMRSDAMTVASINKATGKIRFISLMMDVWVPIPGFGMGKLNAPVVFGGPRLSVKVVNEAFSLYIRKYVMINIFDMIEFIDSIGGIDIEITDEEAAYIDDRIYDTRDIAHRDYEITFLGKGGLRHLNGLQAVEHTRDRYVGYIAGRENRINDVIKAVIKKVKSEMSFTEALMFALRSLKYVKTNIGIITGLRILRYGLKADLNSIETYHAPGAGTYEIKKDGTWRMETDFNKASYFLWKFIMKE